jgi:PAS domain S-box-containing protein
MRIGGETKFTGMLHDLTKRMHLQSELGASEARWKAIIDSAVDGIVVIDAHGRIEAFNPAAERLFGYAAEEVIGRNVDMLMPSPYREEHDTYLARYLATERAKIIGIGRDVQGLRRDGTTFPFHLSVGQITIEDERKFTGILHDLSSRVQMEGQLREQAALAKLGEMAAVIAHEVKNPRGSRNYRFDVPDCVHRRRPRYPGRDTREDLYTLLYHEVTRFRSGATHRETAYRRAQRSDCDRLSRGGWNNSRRPNSPGHRIEFAFVLRAANVSARHHSYRSASIGLSAAALRAG